MTNPQFKISLKCTGDTSLKFFQIKFVDPVGTANIIGANPTVKVPWYLQ